jgi:hypothetical protein
MKKLISILVLVFSLIYTVAFTETLKLKWDYPLQDQKSIEGFHVYRDNQKMEGIVASPEARVIIIPRQMDKQSHYYHVVPFNGKNEGDLSKTVVDSYVPSIKAVGNVTLEILHN